MSSSNRDNSFEKMLESFGFRKASSVPIPPPSEMNGVQPLATKEQLDSLEVGMGAINRVTYAELADGGSFNRTQPTAKGGYVWPAHACGWRRMTPEGKLEWVSPEDALGLPKVE